MYALCISRTMQSQKKADYIEICNSYTGNFAGSGDTEDLSDVKGGYRTYENKEMLFKVDVPQVVGYLKQKCVQPFEFLNSGSNSLHRRAFQLQSYQPTERDYRHGYRKTAIQMPSFLTQSFSLSLIYSRGKCDGISARYYTISKEMNDR